MSKSRGLSKFPEFEDDLDFGGTTSGVTIESKPATDWTSENRVLKSGERARESDTDRYKIGDGATNYNDLPYTHGGAAIDANVLMVEVADL